MNAQNNAPNSNEMQVYVAFSIHGTNCFITANKNFPYGNWKIVDDDLGEDQYEIVQSRDFSNRAQPRTFKVQLTQLNTKSGNPLRSPSWIANRFSQLEEKGWIVDREKFFALHFDSKSA